MHFKKYACSMFGISLSRKISIGLLYLPKFGELRGFMRQCLYVYYEAFVLPK